jgi:hypothetical protein
VIHQGHFIAVVGAFLMGCSILLVVGCAGVRSEAPQEQQGHTEATKEQTHSGTATSEEARCEGTRTFKLPLHESAVEGWELRGTYTTNDVPACLKGGPLSPARTKETT